MSDEQLQSTAPEQATAADSGAASSPDAPPAAVALVEHADLDLTGFTPREAAFVREYLVDLIGAQAAIRAGYSEHSARDIASELLRKPHIKRAIHLALDARARRTQISADRALVEAARIAFVTVDDFEIDEAGNVQVKADRPPGALAAVASLKRKTRTTTRGPITQVVHEVELRFWDKNAAIATVLKHTGATPPERLELTGAGGGPVQHEVTHRGTIAWAGKEVTL